MVLKIKRNIEITRLQQSAVLLSLFDTRVVLKNVSSLLSHQQSKKSMQTGQNFSSVT